MNSITFCVGYILAVVLVRVSNADFDAFSAEKTTHVGPLNFKYNLNDFLLMEIKLKNIPQSVTAVYVIYSFKKDFFQKDPDSSPKREKDPDEIKNGEVKINIQRSLNHNNTLFDVELRTKDGLCRLSRVAEGRWGSSPSYYQNKSGYIYWHNGWEHDDKKSCLVPNRCEIQMDFKNHCQENLNCNVEADKYTCTFVKEKQNNLKSFFYQTYDTDEPKTKETFREDYTYLEAVGSFYKLYKKPKTWYDARDACAQEGAILFYPENSDEVNAVMSFWNPTPNKDYLWVGISDIKTEGVFVTVDGRSISEVYEKWHPGQPDNYKNKEHCLEIKKTGYNDIQCSVLWLSFICKRSPLQNIQLDSSSIIGPPLYSSAMITKLIFDLELFDNNTSVHVAMPTSKKIQRSDKLTLTAGNVVIKESIVRSQLYSETTEVTFSCEEFKDRSKYNNYVAIINKTREKIQTFNETQKIRRKFKKADSGSILCCLYYVYEPRYDGRELYIRRFVVKKTSLIYKTEVPRPSNTAGRHDQASSSESIDYNWLLYALSAFLGVGALVLALYMISKQGWFKKSQPVEETAELDAQAQDEVLYASLEFVNNRSQPQIQKEESHYSNIIGVLHPH